MTCINYKLFLVLCPLSQLTNVIYDVTVTFPATNAGYCTSSVEVCLTNSSESKMKLKNNNQS